MQSSLLVDINQQNNTDFELQKVHPPTPQANIKAKIEEINKRLGRQDFSYFLMYLSVCFLACSIYLFQSIFHFRVYGVESTSYEWLNMLVLWFILQYVVEALAFVMQSFVAASIAVVLFAVNLLLLIALVVIFGMAYHYSTNYQLLGASEGTHKIMERIMLCRLIGSVVVLTLQLFINLPVSIKVLILFKRRRSLEIQLTKVHIQAFQI